MSIFSRIATIVKSNVNELLNSFEDPGKMLVQAISDMQENLREAKIMVAKTIRDKKAIERKYHENLEQANLWAKRAELAVSKGDDELALEALKRKKEFEQMAMNFKTQLDEQTKIVEELKTKITQLEDKINEYKRKKDFLIAKNNTVKAKLKINKQKAKIGSNNIFETFDRMEDKINSLDDQADAFEEIEDLSSDKALEEKFKNLDKTSDVQDELAALKARLRG